MTPRGPKRIAGAAGTEPEQPEPGAARPVTPPAATPTPTPTPTPTVAPGTPAALVPAIESAARNRDMLLAIPGVISVRAGYKFVGGRITDTPAVVVAVDRKVPSPQVSVPAVLPDGTPTDVTPADPFERLAQTGGNEAVLAVQPTLLIDQIQSGGAEAGALEAAKVITYTPPPGVALDPVTSDMVITCHVSPDAGWRTLRPFLESTTEELILGMYDFTAPHIYRTARSLLRDTDVVWRQTLDPKVSLPAEDDVDSNKADDKTETSVITGLRRVAHNRFENAFAKLGNNKTFASAYHIKVAVRDQAAFWLSSGNWQSSNQPAIDFLDPAADRKQIPLFNREWHAVVENEALAQTFRKYLLHDLKTAEETEEAAVVEAAGVAMPDLLVDVDVLLEEERGAVGLEVFPPARFVFSHQNPLTVQPILTPDNYLDVVLPLVRQRPAQRLYFQNQSLNPILHPSPEWEELLTLLADYSQDDTLDVRIIFRNIGPIRKKVESLQAAGFRMDRVRMQSGCHTKGIVVDSATVLLGSHNWSNEGVSLNRDASLLIHNAEIAGYYERVFLHDWDHLAKDTINEEAVPVPVSGATEAAAVSDGRDVRRIPWSTWMEE
jgi:hypothetical protein